MPVMIGCAATYTLGTARRAAFAAEQGADAIRVAIPFWMEIEYSQVVPFFKKIAGDPISRPLNKTCRPWAKCTTRTSLRCWNCED